MSDIWFDIYNIYSLVLALLRVAVSLFQRLLRVREVFTKLHCIVILGKWKVKLPVPFKKKCPNALLSLVTNATTMLCESLCF